MVASRQRESGDGTVIRKAVIPVAGIGSRMLPLTRALPKEMLPVGDRPVIEHTVRELVECGITDITIVVSGRKALVQQHFAPDEDLEGQLRATGKEQLAHAISRVSSLANISYVYQQGPYGNGTPILNAARYWHNEAFLVLWADDVFVSETPRAQQLIEAYQATKAPVIALTPIEPQSAPDYGVPVLEKQTGEGRFLISGLVEKPAVHEAPSSFGAIGGYVLTPGVVDEIRGAVETWSRHSEGEIYLTDALHRHAAKSPVYGQVMNGTWLDTGSMLSYFKAQLTYMTSHPTYGDEVRDLALRLCASES